MSINRLSRLGLSASVLAVLCAACGGGGTGSTGTGGSSSTTTGGGGDATTTGTMTTSSSTATGTGGGGPVCGNSKVETGEDCDDGNTTDDDACSNDCKKASCGDGKLQMSTGEECDDGAQNSDTGACTKACKKAACGDGFVQMGEECDEGAQNSDTGTCTKACKKPACGDGFLQTGEECDSGAMNSDTGLCTSMCKNAVCGDNLVSPAEGCDLGMMNSDTGACTKACKSATCGDALVQMNVEQCDLGMGNNSDTGACTTMCKNAVCGDGLVRTGVEECDQGGMNSDDAACTSSCQNAKCGDGLVQAGVEECDLGGQNANTGTCTLACKNAKCGDGFKQGAEVCDDGNAVNGDGCNNDCIISGTPLITKSDPVADAWYAITKDPSGNIITAGVVTVAGQGQNAIVQKHDAMGNILWTQPFNGAANGDDAAYGVTTDKNGNVIAVGVTTTSGGGLDIWVRKYDPNGATQWTAPYAGNSAQPTYNDYGLSVATNATNDVFITGGVVVSPAAGFDIVVAKFAGANGSLVWADTVAGTASQFDFGSGITVDAAGAVIADGNIRNTANNSDIWVKKYTDNGAGFSAQWMKTINGASNSDDFGSAIAVDAMNNVFLAGSQTVTGQGLNTFVTKYDAGGSLAWTATSGANTPLADEALGIAVDPNGLVAVGGYATQANMKQDIWVQKFTAAGVPIGAPAWPQKYDGNADSDDSGNGVVCDAAGDVWVAGAETTLAQGLNGFLRKYAP